VLAYHVERHGVPVHAHDENVVALGLLDCAGDGRAEPSSISRPMGPRPASSRPTDHLLIGNVIQGEQSDCFFDAQREHRRAQRPADWSIEKQFGGTGLR
jgi:hypothetical protein